MKKNFIVIAPDSGDGDRTVVVIAAKNSEAARISQITISGGDDTYH